MKVGYNHELYFVKQVNERINQAAVQVIKDQYPDIPISPIKLRNKVKKHLQRNFSLFKNKELKKFHYPLQLSPG